MKSYTSIEQSKILAKILPIESADMYWFRDNTEIPKIYPKDMMKDSASVTLPCWSLAALLYVLPTIDDDEFEPQLHRSLDKYRCTYEGEEDSSGLWRVADNPIDACYEMILKLHELKLL
jgi:hypothetical protein